MTAPNGYPLGSTIRLKATFRDKDTEAPTDPASVVFKLMNPAGQVSQPLVVQDGIGSFHADVNVPAAASSVGTWYWRWEGVGATLSAQDGYFEVAGSRFY